MIKISGAAPTADDVLAVGLKNLWYAVCPSGYVQTSPVSIRRFGKKIAIWRDGSGKLHALEDHCPHRGAPLSQGVILGDRLACPYHGVEVRCDGTVTKVPGSPGCKMEGSRPTLAFHVREAHGAIFLYNSAENTDSPPELLLPEELTSPEYSNFLCYVEWKGDYRYVLENVMDPMHGTFLHKQSHTMSEGDSKATFRIVETDSGYIFEKEGQRGVNFDLDRVGGHEYPLDASRHSLSQNRWSRWQFHDHWLCHPDLAGTVQCVLLALPESVRLAQGHLALPLSQSP